MQSTPRLHRVSSSVVSADLDDETVLLNIDSGIYYGLDPVGTRIWELLVNGLDEDAIVQALLAEYDVPSHVLRDDVIEFLNTLEQRQLISSVHG